MNKVVLISLAFTGGVLLALQGGLNAQLGVLLKNSLLATLVAYFFSTCFALLIVLGTQQQLPSLQEVKTIPVYLWFLGGLFSVMGISLYYYTIPKLGVSTMITFGLCGQLILSFIAGHFGWFGLPEEPITLQRSLGLIALLSGVWLINKT